MVRACELLFLCPHIPSSAVDMISVQAYALFLFCCPVDQKNYTLLVLGRALLFC